jgi:hypothetical protein
MLHYLNNSDNFKNKLSGEQFQAFRDDDRLYRSRLRILFWDLDSLGHARAPCLQGDTTTVGVSLVSNRCTRREHRGRVRFIQSLQSLPKGSCGEGSHIDTVDVAQCSVGIQQ